MAKVRAALIALTCAGALLSSADEVSFQGQTISYTGASATNWVANAETAGGYDFVLVFSDSTTPGSFTLPADALLTSARILAVGGGGAGGSGATNTTKNAAKQNGGNGGGGGGGVVELNNLYLEPGSFSVSVGAGGAAAASGASAIAGADGSPSFVSSGSSDIVRAEGGGGGGALSFGRDGANGGGGSQTTLKKNAFSYVAQVSTGGVATVANGFAGGLGNVVKIGGGGGGAGAAGADASAGGEGGDGVASDITGTSAYYGGGGGGGRISSSSSAIAGGLGGGGAGGVSVNSSILAENGQDGLGGGGGGGGDYSATFPSYALGGAGGSGVVVVRISAIYAKPEKPSASVSFAYDGEEKAALEENPSYEITSDWKGKATDAGTYTATVALKPALVAQGLTWTDGTTNDVDVTMTITQAENEIETLSLESWIVGQLANAASATATFGTPALAWSDSETGEFKPYGTTGGNCPTAVGTYYLKATVSATTNYKGAEKTLVFYVWASPSAAYDDCVEITLTGLTDAEALVDFPVLVRLSESTIHGFSYARAGATGEDVVFTSVDGSTRYPHEVDVWNTTGESLVWVRVPKVTATTTLLLRWCAKDGYETPAYVPEKVWSAYLGVWHFAGVSQATWFKDSTGNGLTASLNGTGASCAAASSSSIGSAICVTNGTLEASNAAASDGVSTFALYTWTGAAAQPTVGEVKASAAKVTLAKADETVDEVRLAAKPFSEAWLDAESRTVAQPDCVAYGTVKRAGKMVDWWKKEASISKTTWRVNEDAGELTEPEANSGRDVTTVISNLMTSATYEAMPTAEPGCYRVTCEVPGDGDYETLTATIDFQIVGEATTYDDLKGDAESLTLGGRVLLANDDVVEGHVITNQGWWQKGPVVSEGLKKYRSSTFWNHSGSWTGSQGTFRTGVNHDLIHLVNTTTTNIIWRLRNVIIGSPYTGSAKSTIGDRCALPYSTTARGISKPGIGQKAIASAAEAGMMIFRNTTDSAIYSPCYTNGIGTIYFDAVNMAASAEGDNTTLAVEVATETLDGSPLTEESSHTVNEDGSVNEFENIEKDAGLDSKWKEAAILVLKKDGTAGFVSEGLTNRVALSIATGGSDERFYRLVVPVNFRGASRFRIRRASRDGSTTNLDTSFILVDNIVVSPPKMAADVKPYGVFDKSADAAVPGCAGAMDVAFPAIGESVTGRARIETWTNGAVKDADPASFITLSRLHYRWRYLNQQVGEWQSSILAAEADGALKSVEPMNLPDREGDVEFWFESYLSVPYYEFFDYTGKDYDLKGADGAALYTESEGDVYTNRYQLVTSTNTLASCGTDWFFRLRPTKSQYERWRVLTCTNETADVVKTNEMSLSTSGTWRGFAKTLEAPADGKIRFRFEGLNRQTDGATDYAYSTNDWQAASLEKTPAEAAVSEGSSWATAPCDAKTGYLLFQLTEPTDDAAGEVLVARADMQDFNVWGLANDELFSGSSGDTNYTSLATQTYEMKNDSPAWPFSSATNATWTQKFDVSSGVVARVSYPRNIPFTSAVSGGWEAEYGMWICKKWAYETAKGFGDETALQLQGRGRGQLTFADNANMPSGLDKVVVNARVAQYNEFNDFTYFDGDIASGRATRQTRYTFVTKLALTCEGDDSFMGDGSVSLVAAYRPNYGCYELRFSRSMTNEILRAELFKWTSAGDGAIRATSLGATGLSGKSTKKLVQNTRDYGAAFLTIEPGDDGTKIYGGLYTGAEKIDSSLTWPDCIGDTKFDVVSYYDKDEPLTKGTCGVLARNCPGVFNAPYVYDQAFTIAGVTDKDPDAKLTYTSTTVTIPSSVAASKTALDVADDWISSPGRTEPQTNQTSGALLGFRASTNTTQQLILQLSPVGKTTWTDFCTNSVTGFANQEIEFPVRSGQSCNVRLKTGGSYDGVRTDVVINEVRLEQWAGETARDYGTASGDPGLSEKFVYLQSWIVADGDGNRVVRLQPTRTADADKAMTVRSPILTGLGRVGFSWRNADTNAVLLLQCATNVAFRTLKNNLKSWTDRPSDGVDWVTLKRLDFSDPAQNLGASGTLTYNSNLRAPVCGVYRLVVDRGVLAKACQSSVIEENPLYGSIEITDFYAWDLPAYDKRCWTGWNFRTSGWANGVASSYANLHDYAKGLSGLLNNTLDEATLKNPFEGASEGGASLRDYYKQNPPSVQSPTFMSNYVGVVEFKARLYDANDLASAGHPAVVTVYGADAIDDNGEPTSWTAVTNVEVSAQVYTTYYLKLKNSQNFYALRLAVKGVEGVDGNEKPANGYASPLRVAIDDVCLWEKTPLSVAFRKDHVRPFRNAARLKDAQVVADIDSAEEQPLLEETFGFQAEVEVRDTEEILVDDPSRPISVTLWYYPGAEPWGYDNWKTNANARRVVLDAADGTNLVFRSTLAKTSSFCSPQMLEADETCRVVQYQMLVTFYDRSGEKVEDQPMSSSEWAMPSWDTGFDDPNKKDGASFSAFTVLEKIAPRRAWINEVNLLEYSGEKNNSEENQWIELAIPTAVDMSGWSLNVYESTGDKAGTLLTFGKNDCPSRKSQSPVSSYEFYVAKSPKTKLEGADATWRQLSSLSSFVSKGTFNSSQVFGFELVRPSGIVEHRAVVQGYNLYKDLEWYVWPEYDGSNIVEKLNAKTSTSPKWVWAEEDFKKYSGCTVGVTNNQGQAHEDWHSPMGATPGDINENQVIDPDWFTRPNGGFRWIDAVVRGLHLRQIVEGETNTTMSLAIEDGKSTNFVYEVDRWYRLGTPTIVPATTATTLVEKGSAGGKRYYALTIGNLTNDVRITAQAEVAENLEEHLANVGAYKPAILNWLESGNFEGDEILLGKYRGATGSDAETQDLTLLVHYWLDLDPTCGGWELWGGMGEKGGGSALGPVNNSVVRTRDDTTLAHTNIQTTVWLMITNTVTGVAYPPSRLQGLGNEKSDEFGGTWTSATFKVEMQLYKGAWRGRFRAMRYFVFGPNSFRPADDDTAPFASRIEITDPFSRQSPAWEWGWWRYAEEGMSPWTRWNLNEEITPGGVTTLKADDTLTY